MRASLETALNFPGPISPKDAEMPGKGEFIELPTPWQKLFQRQALAPPLPSWFIGFCSKGLLTQPYFHHAPRPLIIPPDAATKPLPCNPV